MAVAAEIPLLQVAARLVEYQVVVLVVTVVTLQVDVPRSEFIPTPAMS